MGAAGASGSDGGTAAHQSRSSEGSPAPSSRRAEREVVVVGHGERLVAHALKAVLDGAGMRTRLAEDLQSADLQSVAVVVVCATPGARRAASLLLASQRPRRRRRPRVIAIDDAAHIAADVRIPTGAAVGDLVRAVAGLPVADSLGAARRSAAKQRNADHPVSGLTDREAQVVRLLVEGADTHTMVATLGVSRQTVRTYIQSVLEKFGVRSRVEVAGRAAALVHLLPQVDIVRSPPDRHAGG